MVDPILIVFKMWQVIFKKLSFVFQRRKESHFDLEQIAEVNKDRFERIPLRSL